MKTSGSLQEFIELITAEVRKMSPKQKREFREAWLAASNRSSLKLTGVDVRWLRKIKINPEGD